MREAIARYHRRRADYQRAVLHAIVSGSSGPAKRALDAAVRDCMLAAVAAVVLYNPRPGGIATTAPQVEAEIERQFGLPEGSGNPP